MDGNDQEYGFPEHLIYSIVYLQDEIIDWAKERDPHLIIALVLNNIEYLKTLQTKNKSGEEVKDPQKQKEEQLEQDLIKFDGLTSHLQ